MSLTVLDQSTDTGKVFAAVSRASGPLSCAQVARLAGLPPKDVSAILWTLWQEKKIGRRNQGASGMGLFRWVRKGWKPPVIGEAL